MSSSLRGSKRYLGDCLVFDEMKGLRPVTQEDLKNKKLKWCIVGPNGELIDGVHPPLWDIEVDDMEM